VHSETGLAPLPRWLEGGPYPVPAPAILPRRFPPGPEHRPVLQNRLVSLHGNRYQVTPRPLAGRSLARLRPVRPAFPALRLDWTNWARAARSQSTRHSSPRPHAGCRRLILPVLRTLHRYLGLIEGAPQRRSSPRRSTTPALRPGPADPHRPVPGVPQPTADPGGPRPFPEHTVSEKLQANYGFNPQCPFGRDLARLLHPTPPTTKPSPDQLVQSLEPPSAWSPAKSEPGKRCPSRHLPCQPVPLQAHG